MWADYCYRFTHEKKDELRAAQWWLKTAVLLFGTLGYKQLNKASPTSWGKKETTTGRAAGHLWAPRWIVPLSASLCLWLPPAPWPASFLLRTGNQSDQGSRPPFQPHHLTEKGSWASIQNFWEMGLTWRPLGLSAVLSPMPGAGYKGTDGSFFKDISPLNPLHSPQSDPHPPISLIWLRGPKVVNPVLCFSFVFSTEKAA